jgi:hypothetical protein
MDLNNALLPLTEYIFYLLMKAVIVLVLIVALSSFEIQENLAVPRTNIGN